MRYPRAPARCFRHDVPCIGGRVEHLLCANGLNRSLVDCWEVREPFGEGVADGDLTKWLIKLPVKRDIGDSRHHPLVQERRRRDAEVSRRRGPASLPLPPPVPLRCAGTPNVRAHLPSVAFLRGAAAFCTLRRRFSFISLKNVVAELMFDDPAFTARLVDVQKLGERAIWAIDLTRGISCLRTRRGQVDTRRLPSQCRRNVRFAILTGSNSIMRKFVGVVGSIARIVSTANRHRSTHVPAPAENVSSGVKILVSDRTELSSARSRTRSRSYRNTSRIHSAMSSGAFQLAIASEYELGVVHARNFCRADTNGTSVNSRPGTWVSPLLIRYCGADVAITGNPSGCGC